tara:strand:- start:115 stop:681 length:567 start_codon:yes stop_codon:yes gene_type:complete
MKRLITFILLILTQITIVYGQDSLEITILNKVNEYRVSKGLSKIVFDSWIFEQAENHSVYCSKVGYIYHKQEIDVPGHKELLRLGERIYRTNNYKEEDVIKCYENLALLSQVSSDNVTIRTNEDIADRVLKMWIGSPTHLEILNKSGDVGEYFKGAISIEISNNHPWNEKIPYIYVTLNYVKYVYNNN